MRILRAPVSQPAKWSFLTNHARVLMCIAEDPGIRLREIGSATGITERAAHRLVRDLVDAGYVTRRRVGRRNQYAIRIDLPVPDARNRPVGDLLDVLLDGSGPPRSGSGASGLPVRESQEATEDPVHREVNG